MVRSSLNIIGPRNVISFVIIRRDGFVGMGLTLQEKVCHCEGGLGGLATIKCFHLNGLL